MRIRRLKYPSGLGNTLGNVTKIDSRPTGEYYDDYRFYLDKGGDLTSIAEGRRLSELKVRSRTLLAHGMYRCLG